MLNEAIGRLLHTISDHGDAAISKAINYIGLMSVGGGAANYVAKKSAASEVAVMTQEAAQQTETLLTVTDYAGIVSIVGGCVFIVKTCADLYFNYRKHKREEAKD